MALNETPEREKAEFNMAIESLRQISGWFLLANDAAVKLDAFSWYHYLLAIYREISPFMDKKELEYVQQETESLLVPINDCLRSQEKTGISRIEPRLYKRLNDLHLYFKKILKDNGMLMKMAEDAGHALR